MQNDKSLFLRDQPHMYLVDWAIVPAIAIAGCWGLALILYCSIQLCGTKHNRIANVDFEGEAQQKQDQEII